MPSNGAKTGNGHGVHPKVIKHNDAAAINATEMQLKSLELRKRAYSYEQIGKALGISKQAAYVHVKKALEHLRLEVTEVTDEVKQLELARLDAMIARLWRDAMPDDPNAEADHKKMETMLKVMDRRAKYLGLDAATKHEVFTVDAIDSAIAELERELAGRGGEVPSGN